MKKTQPPHLDSMPRCKEIADWLENNATRFHGSAYLSPTSAVYSYASPVTTIMVFVSFMRNGECAGWDVLLPACDSNSTDATLAALDARIAHVRDLQRSDALAGA